MGLPHTGQSDDCCKRWHVINLYDWNLDKIMNSMFALMIVTTTGVVEAPNNFSTMKECQAVVDKNKFTAYCVEKKPVNIEKEMNMLLTMFKRMQREFEDEKR